MSSTPVLFDALADVAERNFFAFADADTGEFDGLVEGTDGWVVAAVAFDGAGGGAMACALPAALAQELYASFTAADPGDEAPVDRLDDLLGEFANMVCGAWLTRQSSDETFALGRPLVLRTGPEWRPGGDAAAIDPRLVRALVNGQPVALAVSARGLQP